MSLRELARRVGVSPSLVSQIELDRVNPSVSTLYALVSELGMTMSDVFGDGAQAAPQVRRSHPDDDNGLLTHPDERRVINLASVAGIRANPGQANYSASKAGVIGFTKTVAAEVARRGVTVNAVAPGLIETAFTEDVMEGEMAKAIPARRVGTPEEVAACIRFLASAQASYVTGTTLTVDGGLSA